MGRRELLLIVGFVVVGALVYQITAPPPAPGERGFSFGRILDNVRREIRGNRASGQATSTAIEPADGLEEVRFRIRNGDITVTGEDRQDIAAEMQVTSNGSDQAEAERLARATRLKFDRAGTTLDLTMVAPDPGIQRPTIVLKVPSRFRVRIDPSIGRLKIDNIAESRSSMPGDAARSATWPVASATTASGELIVASVGRLRVTSRAPTSGRRWPRTRRSACARAISRRAPSPARSTSTRTTPTSRSMPPGRRPARFGRRRRGTLTIRAARRQPHRGAMPDRRESIGRRRSRSTATATRP